MKKLLLLVAIISFVELRAQNYFESTFIGEIGVNSPTSVFESDKGVLVSGLIGGGLSGNYPISYAGGNADGVLVKLSNLDGSVQWVKSFGGNSDEVVIDAVIDPLGNHYLTGYFMGAGANALDADPGPNTYPLSVNSTLANRDIFIIKLDVNGDFVWAKQMSSPSGGANDDVATIKLDVNGNIYLAGSYTYVDFDPGAGSQTLVANGSSGAFIVKLDNNGDFLWVKTLEGTSNKKIVDLEIDNNGNILVAGRFQGNIDLNPDSIVQDLRTTSGNNDAFIAKYTSDGVYLWGLTFGGTGSDTLEKMFLNGNDLFVGGSFNGTVDFDPSSNTNSYVSAGGQDGFLSKFDLDGNYLGSFVIPGTTTNLDTVKDIYVDIDGNVYLSGLFQNITLNSLNYMSSASNSDAFYLKLDSNLVFSNIYLVQGNGAQNIPLITQLSDLKFLALGRSTGVASYDYTNQANTEGNPVPSGYIYISRFDFETTVLSSEDFNFNNQILLYPNPVSSEFGINVKDKIVSVEIYSYDGKQVLTKLHSEILSVNVETLSSGIYIVQMTDEFGNKYASKFIKK